MGDGCENFEMGRARPRRPYPFFGGDGIPVPIKLLVGLALRLGALAVQISLLAMHGNGSLSVGGFFPYWFPTTVAYPRRKPTH